MSFIHVAFSLILFSFFHVQFKPDKRTVHYDIRRYVCTNISLLSRFNEKKTEDVKLIGTCTLFCVCSPVTCLLVYNTIFWLKARRKERREMFL